MFFFLMNEFENDRFLLGIINFDVLCTYLGDETSHETYVAIKRNN